MADDQAHSAVQNKNMTTSLRPEVIRKIELARSFFDLAQAAAKSSHDLNLFVAINQVQDAVEIFLFGLAEHLGVTFKEKSSFDGYFDSISTKIGGPLPFRQRLIALNKARVNSKHYAIQPDRGEVNGFIAVAKEFFIEASQKHLEVGFEEISLVHLLSNEKIRSALTGALQALTEKRYTDALIECRKAFYIEFEQRYDISRFKDLKTTEWSWTAGWGCRAPSYTRNAEYIAKNVTDPTDFIVFDHSRVDADLSKEGISHKLFWNVWRITPQMFYLAERDEWFVKGEFRVMEETGFPTRAEYAVHSTIELCLTVQRNHDATRSGPYGAWTVKIRPGEVRLYNKADVASEWTILPLVATGSMASMETSFGSILQMTTR